MSAEGIAEEREAAGAQEPSPPGASRWLGWCFALAILVSAFLLFQVQPLVSKSILPWFGGCPAVWTTAMLFFQCALFAGYVYAHLLQRWLPPSRQAVVHFGVVAVALAVLPILPGPGWKPVDSADPTWRVLLLLAASVGLPYFALSATSPLVQAWFSRVWSNRSPYRLYALSNVGSLVGLLSYPFVFEPAFDLSTQSTLWSWSFLLYAALCAGSLVCLARMGFAAGTARSVGQIANLPGSGKLATCPTAGGCTPAHRLLWVALPATASLMLLATTNHVCQNVAVVPLLWIVPLTLYLLSFIVCFDHSRWYVRRFWAPATIVALVAVAINEASSGNGVFTWLDGQTGWQLTSYHSAALHWLDHHMGWQLALYFSAMFFACMVCHGELVRLKPDPRRLTEFYLLIAAGGALGGIFVGLVAPLLFNTFAEWPISLVACFLIAALALVPPPKRFRLAVRGMLAASAAGLGCALFVSLPAGGETTIDRARNFYGVVCVREYPAKGERILVHGTITHGQQFLDAKKSRWPTTYYGEESGVGQAIGYFRDRGHVRVGAVGLGAGTLAAYARPGDSYRFYEINPQVHRMAREDFTYLANCQGALEVVMGDARLSLEREILDGGPPQFDVLVLDAFSGDSIPVHLLTAEAFDIYGPHLAKGGVIAVHISNRYLYLAPVVYGLAQHFGFDSVRIDSEEDEDRAVNGADWILLTRNEDFLLSVEPTPIEEPKDDFTVPLWTDKYNNLFQILRRG